MFFSRECRREVAIVQAISEGQHCVLVEPVRPPRLVPARPQSHIGHRNLVHITGRVLSDRESASWRDEASQDIKDRRSTILARVCRP